MRRQIGVGVLHAADIAVGILAVAAQVHRREVQLEGRGVGEWVRELALDDAELQSLGGRALVQKHGAIHEGALLRVGRRGFGDENQIDVALFGVEAVQRQRAMKIYARQRFSEALAGVAYKFIQQGLKFHGVFSSAPCR